jgi:hypothetical protein
MVIVALAVAATGCGTAQTASSGPAATNPTTTGPSSAAAQTTAPVPAQYQGLYDTLESQLGSFQAATGAHRVSSSTVLSSALEAADGNAMHPGVLTGGALGKSTEMIDRMKAIGETGVTVQVSFPLLLPSFPDSSEYTTFYQDVAQAVHRQGMTLTVELNPLFGNISSLPITSFYAGLTLQSYAADDQQMAQTIIDDMHPKYLSILNEPDTYTAVIHNPAIDLDNSATGVRFVDGVLDGLDRDGTLVGAGTGTWTDPDYDRALIDQSPIDFVDLHMYPVAPVDVSNMKAQVAAADAAGKPIVMSECWLYKETTDGQPADTAQSAPNEQRIGTYSFWEPIDSEFLTTMVEYAQDQHFAVVSPFDTLNFFSYQTYSPALGAESATQVRDSFYRQVSAAMGAGDLSGVGRTYESLAS